MINTGDTAWVLISAALVFIMTPGLAFFYGGMVRSKNVLTTIMQSFFIVAMISVEWVLIGYAMTFGTDINGFIGNLDKIGLAGVGYNILENGTIPVRESNVFDYSERSIIAHNRPKYIFIHCDEVKKAYATFRVPASFNIRNCHFENAKFYNLKDIDWDKFGDSMTSICTVHFSGMEFDPEDFGDKGTWGSTNFILFKYDETRDSYDEVASME